jgi:hypothetical protein
LGATGEPVFVGGDGAQDFGDGQGGDPPVVGAELAAQAGDAPAQHDGHQYAHTRAHQRRIAGRREDAGGIGADAGKGDVTEVEQARIAGLQVKTQRHDGVDAGDGQGKDQEIKHDAPRGRTGRRA